MIAYQLIATLTPNSADNKNVNWSSSDTSVATVSSSSTASGTAITVTAKGGGTATITATAADGSGKKASCSLTVTIDPSNYTWTQSKTTVTGTAKNGSGAIVKLEVGSAYIYNAGVSGGYTGNWGILGAGVGDEAGKLLIMTTRNVGTIELKGKDGYNNGISQLNALCVSKCGTGARSINVDDINRVTGYNPTNQGDGTVYGAGQWYEYGNVVTYTENKTTSTKVTTPYTGGLYKSVYYHPDGRTIGSNGVTSITETSTYYSYYVHSLTTDSSRSGTCKGIPTTSPAYKMIFNDNLLLASMCVDTSRQNVTLLRIFFDSNWNCYWFDVMELRRWR